MSKFYTLFIGYSTPYDLDVKYDYAMDKLDKHFSKANLAGDTVHVIPEDKLEEAEKIIHKLNKKYNANMTCDIEEWDHLDIENDLTNKLLDELYNLTLYEQKRELTEEEKRRYVEIIDYLQENNTDIPFGIEI